MTVWEYYESKKYSLEKICTIFDKYQEVYIVTCKNLCVVNAPFWSHYFGPCFKVVKGNRLEGKRFCYISMLYPKYIKCHGFRLSKKEREALCELLVGSNWTNLIKITNYTLKDEKFEELPMYDDVPDYTKLRKRYKGE